MLRYSVPSTQPLHRAKPSHYSCKLSAKLSIIFRYKIFLGYVSFPEHKKLGLLTLTMKQFLFSGFTMALNINYVSISSRHHSTYLQISRCAAFSYLPCAVTGCGSSFEPTNLAPSKIVAFTLFQDFPI